MIVIGVTGSFGSGKSQVSSYLKTMGAKLFDADIEARQALKRNRLTYQALIQIFGAGITTDRGEIDRKKLAERVFSRPKELKKLNTLIHPSVIFAAMQFIKKNRKRAKYVVLDVPLLFESRMEKLADVVIVVSASLNQLLSRTKNRGVRPALVKKILASQWPSKTKERRADFVIKNSGSVTDLKKQTKFVFQQIKKDFQQQSK